MKKILTVYFGENRTYFTLTGPAKKGYELKFVHFDKFTPNLQNEDINGKLQSVDFADSIREIFETADKMNIVLPSHTYHSALIPKPVEYSSENLKKLCELDIRFNFPEKVYEDFNVFAIPLQDSKKTYKYFSVEFIENSIIENYKILLTDVNVPIEKIISFSSASASSLKYNYPEIKNEPSAIFNFGSKQVNVLVIKDGLLIYQSQILCETEYILNEILRKEIEKVEDLSEEKINNLFLAGEFFTPEILEDLRKQFSNNIKSINRFNSFRMLTTNLGREYREYCSRMAHVFPPCIGGGLPACFEIINVW